MNETETDLLEAAAEHLRNWGFAVDIEHADHAERAMQLDAAIHLRRGKHDMRYAVEIKRQVTPATLGAVVAQLKRREQYAKAPLLLMTHHVTQPVADQLVALNQQFVDAAGNAYLKAPGNFVLVTGRKPEHRNVEDRPGRAYTTAGLKTLFAFIRNPQLAAAPYREIADQAGVALGALPAVLAALEQAGHLQVLGRKRRLLATRRMLDDWALAYARTLRPKQLMRTLVAPKFENWRDWDLKPDHAKWGGEPAAALLTQYLKPGVLTLYAEKPPARLMLEHRLTAARPNDEYGLVEIRQPFWADGADEGIEGTVAPALVYADLLATGDGRCIETAQIIYETRLAGLFPQN